MRFRSGLVVLHIASMAERCGTVRALTDLWSRTVQGRTGPGKTLGAKSAERSATGSQPRSLLSTASSPHWHGRARLPAEAIVARS
jgi:hypothetical protein